MTATPAAMPEGYDREAWRRTEAIVDVIHEAVTRWPDFVFSVLGSTHVCTVVARWTREGIPRHLAASSEVAPEQVEATMKRIAFYAIFNHEFRKLERGE